MKFRQTVVFFLILAWAAAATPRQILPIAVPSAESQPIVIPFELINRHIFIKVRINNSEPLWFILDTGDKFAVVDLNRAKSLDLSLQGEINVGGAGAGTLKGSRVRGASLTVMGIENRPQPVVLAIPLDDLKPRLGHEVDGIIGADFIRETVMEIDYPAGVLRLYDKDTFSYSGKGESVEIHLNSSGHAIVPAEVTILDRPPIKGEFVLDVGSGGSLVLHRPFVERERLPPSTQKTIGLLGGFGAGGRTSGSMGRITELKIGTFSVANPVTAFSMDQRGAFASSETLGNIGQQILSKFKLLLDYSRNRIIFEPNATLADPIMPVSSGIRIVGEGPDYKTFRVDELLDDGPAVEAGLQTNDLITAIDGRPADGHSLTTVNQTLEKPGPHKLSIRRGEQTLQIALTPRKTI